MLKTETKTINGHDYTVTLFPAMEAYLLGRQMLGCFTSKNPIEKLCEIDASGELTLKLLTSTIRDQEAITKSNFDRIFTGNLIELAQILAFILEVNFKDFFPANATGALQESLSKVISAT